MDPEQTITEIEWLPERPRFLDAKEFKMADEVINAKRRQFLKMSGQNCAKTSKNSTVH